MTLRMAVPALALLLCLPASAGASTIAGKRGRWEAAEGGQRLRHASAR